jgi:hypothetical protein
MFQYKHCRRNQHNTSEQGGRSGYLSCEVGWVLIMWNGVKFFWKKILTKHSRRPDIEFQEWIHTRSRLSNSSSASKYRKRHSHQKKYHDRKQKMSCCQGTGLGCPVALLTGHRAGVTGSPPSRSPSKPETEKNRSVSRWVSQNKKLTTSSQWRRSEVLATSDIKTQFQSLSSLWHKTSFTTVRENWKSSLTSLRFHGTPKESWMDLQPAAGHFSRHPDLYRTVSLSMCYTRRPRLRRQNWFSRSHSLTRLGTQKNQEGKKKYFEDPAVLKIGSRP